MKFTRPNFKIHKELLPLNIVNKFQNQNVQQAHSNKPKRQSTPNFWFKEPLIDPRDIKIQLNLDQLNQLFTNNFQNNERKFLRKHLVQIYQVICSDSWVRYNNGDLTIGQTKAYTAKNIINNINNIFNKINQKISSKTRSQIMKFINDQSEKILKQLIIKYPQASVSGTSRRLRQKLVKTDIQSKDLYDILMYSKNSIDFRLKQDKNYISEIMKAINYFIELPNIKIIQQDGNSQEYFTLFQFFELFLNIVIGSDTTINQISSCENANGFINFLKTKNNTLQNKPQSLLINQKISSQTKKFTNQQIQLCEFRVLDSSIVRIMDKWSQQLQKKIFQSHNYFSNTSQKLKTHGKSLQQIDQVTYSCLTQYTTQVTSQVIQYQSQIKNQSINMQQQMFCSDFSGKYVNQIDTIVGLFSSKSQFCLGQYILHYLNYLIQILAKASAKIDENLLKLNMEKNEFDFITFKVGDLMRAKYQSSQTEIIFILQKMHKISKKYPSVFKIIRVKNRLDKKDNDILLNFFFMQKIQCQIQLSVNAKLHKKQINFNNFNHFIYELARTKFGPIAQCASIITKYDPWTKSISQRQGLMAKTSLQNMLSVKEIKIQEKNQQNFQKNKIKKLPYFCSTCKLFVKNTNPQFFQDKIISNQIKQCNKCYLNRISNQKGQKSIVQKVFSLKNYDQIQMKTIRTHVKFIDQGIQSIKKVLFPQKKLNGQGYGFLIPKKNRKQQPIYFQVVIIQKEDKISRIVIVGCINQKLKILHEINFKIINNSVLNNNILKRIQVSNEQIYKILQKFIFFEIILMPENHKNHNSPLIGVKQSLNNKQQEKQLKCYKFYCNACEQKQPKINLLKGVDIYKSNEKIFQYVLKFFNKKRILDQLTMQKDTLCFANQALTLQFQQLKLNKSYKNVTSLNIANNKIASLQFIDKFKNIQNLDVSMNLLKKLPSFQKNTKLSNFNCANNNLFSIKQLEAVKNLKSIDISGNDLKNLKDLLQCTNIEEIRVTNMKNFSSLQGIQNCKKLKKLQAQHFKDESLIFLSNLTDLQFLFLKFTRKLQSLQGLQNHKKLKKIKAFFSSIKSMKYIKGCTSLQKIYIENSKLEKIDLQENLQSVIKLQIYQSPLQNLQGIGKLTKLKILKIGTCQLQSIIQLQECKELQTIKLPSNKIKNIDNIKNLQNVIDLDVNQNEIQSISSLKQMKSIKYLSFQNNKVTNLSDLQSLQQLQGLNFRKNPFGLSQIQIIKKLNKLKFVNQSNYKDYQSIYNDMKKQKLKQDEKLND